MIGASSLWSLEYLMGEWRPGIGDPTFMGWFTVFSYILCAAVALSVCYLNRAHDKRFARFWLLIGVVMVLLGINKQLDLQSLLPEMGRQIFRAQGWMEMRRIVQFWFIISLGCVSVAVFGWFTVLYRALFRRFMLAFIGIFFLLSFVFIRAASFHHFDAFRELSFLGIKMNWVLELTGIYLVCLAGLKEMILPILRGD
ncbi:hypothetical protein EG829_19295 [bacterium]|nr:hypothetical protein [bacterium]